MHEHKHVGADPLYYLLLGIALLPFIIWAQWLVTYGVNVIRVEQWGMPYPVIRDFFAGDGTLQALLQQHNESRKLWPNLFSTTLALIQGEWDTHSELAIGYALCVLLFMVLGVCLAGSGPTQGWRGGLILLLFSCLLWSPNTWFFHLNSISFERLIPELCLLSGIGLFLTGTRITRFTAAFILLGFVSQFSFAGGAVMWVLLGTLLAARAWGDRKALWGSLGIYLLCFIAATALFFWDYSQPSQTRPFTDILHQPPEDILAFFLMILGRPYVDGYWPGVGVGAVVLGLFLASSTLAFGTKKALAPWWAWTVLGLYSLSQAALITVGRMPMSMQNAERSDYVTHGLYLLIASVALMGACRPLVKWSSALQPAVCVFMLGVLMGSLSASPVDPMREQASQLRHARACIQLNELITLDHCTERPYHWPANIRTRIREASRLGVIEPGLVDAIEPESDSGGFQGRVRVSFWSNEGPLHFVGWAAVDGRPVDAVVVTAEGDNGDEQVVAVFRGGLPDSVVNHETGERIHDVGWGGDIPRSRLHYNTKEPHCGLKAYAMDASDNQFHELDWRANATASWCNEDLAARLASAVTSHVATNWSGVRPACNIINVIAPERARPRQSRPKMMRTNRNKKTAATARSG